MLVRQQPYYVTDGGIVMTNETFGDWLIKKGLYDHYNGMHTYVLEYVNGYPDMSQDTAERYSDECGKIVQQFREDV